MKKSHLLSLAFAGLISAASAQNCLEARYTFSNNLKDVSGNNLNLVRNGTRGSVMDRNGTDNGAYYFDGKTILQSDTIHTSNWTGVTISFWAKTDPSLFQKSAMVQFAGASVWLSKFNINGIVASMGSSPDNISRSDEILGGNTPNTWSHIAVTNEGDTTSIYINGTLKKSYYERLRMPTSGFLVIGGEFWGKWKYKGLIDNVRIYSCALDESKIRTIFDSDIRDDCDNSRYDLNANLKDGSNLGRDLKIDGNVAWETDRFGNPEGAFRLDGNTTLSTGNINTLEWAGMSLSLWIKTPIQLQPRAAFIQLAQNTGWISKSATGKVSANMNGSSIGSNYMESDQIVVSNEWTHIVISNDNERTRIYINRNQCYQQSEQLHTDINSTLIIGGQGDGELKFKGAIDDVRIFACKLSDEDIRELYHDNSTAIATTEKRATGFRIYPNPVSTGNGQTQIQLTELSGTGSSLSITDMQGRIMSTFSIQLGQQSISVKVPELAAGIYMVRITTPSGIATQKLAVE